MEGLDKTYGVQYNRWYRSIEGVRVMIHHDSHKGSLFLTVDIPSTHNIVPGVSYRITNVFEKEEQIG